MSSAFALSPTLAAEPYPVAGLTPWQRPAQAPRLEAVPPLEKRDALHGIATPAPAGLSFIEDQGGWYTPFTHPGMTGPYDLRGWHSPESPSRQDSR